MYPSLVCRFLQMNPSELCKYRPGCALRRKPPAKRYTHLMASRTTVRISLTALLGTPVTDAQGHLLSLIHISVKNKHFLN